MTPYLSWRLSCTCSWSNGSKCTAKWQGNVSMHFPSSTYCPQSTQSCFSQQEQQSQNWDHLDSSFSMAGIQLAYQKWVQMLVEHMEDRLLGTSENGRWLLLLLLVTSKLQCPKHRLAAFTTYTVPTPWGESSSSQKVTKDCRKTKSSQSHFIRLC